MAYELLGPNGTRESDGGVSYEVLACGRPVAASPTGSRAAVGVSADDLLGSDGMRESDGGISYGFLEAEAGAEFLAAEADFWGGGATEVWRQGN